MAGRLSAVATSAGSGQSVDARRPPAASTPPDGFSGCTICRLSDPRTLVSPTTAYEPAGTRVPLFNRSVIRAFQFSTVVLPTLPTVASFINTGAFSTRLAALGRTAVSS